MPNTTERLTVAINGPTLRYVRRGLGLTVARLAAEVDVSTSYIRQLELGHTLVVGIKTYDRLCFALRLDDRRVLLANPADADTLPPCTHPHTTARALSEVGADHVLDAADPVDDALDAPDPVDDALDIVDPKDDRALESLAS